MTTCIYRSIEKSSGCDFSKFSFSRLLSGMSMDSWLLSRIPVEVLSFSWSICTAYQILPYFVCLCCLGPFLFPIQPCFISRVWYSKQFDAASNSICHQLAAVGVNLHLWGTSTKKNRKRLQWDWSWVCRVLRLKHCSFLFCLFI